ncbi:MAG: methyltransferase [Candidatus Methylomirabilia bacterium]
MMGEIPPSLRDSSEHRYLRQAIEELEGTLLPGMVERPPEQVAGRLLDWAQLDAPHIRPASIALALSALAGSPSARSQAVAIVEAIIDRGEQEAASSPLSGMRLAPRQTGLDEQIILFGLPHARLPTRIGRVMLEGLKRYFATFHEPRPNQRAIDVGSGSGVLAIVAAKQLRRHGGVERVWGVDINPWAVLLARANATLNGESESTLFLENDGLAALCQHPMEGSVDLIVSNPPMTAGLPGQSQTAEDRFNVIEHPVEFIKRELIETGARLLHRPTGHLLFHISGRFPEALQNLSSIPGFGPKKAVLQGLTELDPYVDLRGLVYQELIQDQPFIFLKGYPVEIQRVTATEAHVLRKQGGRIYQQSYVWLYGFEP